jgi:ATP-dependent exoDNAse (exonuclease V) alpha subunit
LQLNAPKNLSTEFKELLDQLENSSQHFFITGRAGTGKSTLLNLFRKTSHKNIVVAAPTGIAALNVKGQTIHSLFGFPPRMLKAEDLKKRKNHRFFKKIDSLIIDEISMVRVDMFEAIDIFLKINRENNQPFGGVQVILFGDLFQLPPVIADNYERQYLNQFYKSPYFFSSRAFHRTKFELHELHTVYRQEEKRFIRLLDSIRQKTFDQDELDDLNERFDAVDDDGIPYITLCSTNAIAKAINDKKLNALTEPVYQYEAEIKGQFKRSTYPTDLILRIKKGCQVMFLKNDPNKKYVNGTIATVLETNNNSIQVRIEDSKIKDKILTIEPVDWELSKYVVYKENPKKFTTEIVGVFTQLPVKLAWAITVHKSQGKTFDKVHINLGKGAFDYGQTYVALSRCRSFGGIYLESKLTPKDVMVDHRIQAFYDYQRRHH